ncbi:MAG: hypothetical protein F8N36_13995 [Desulfovibrio sp.]|uniref:hypothetical protein n=1 Tax=Desulfovibrio sp. TaxID=885 RepID=UPI00135D3AB9|nr:hypothetical protein [Desulfovibrio sp.]MTJ93950.1 hypothetical protein [Desulfovibrio sp.]
MSEASDREHPPLAELLALALRHAREVRGYSITQVDRALAQAIALEALQRAAMVPGGAVDGTVSPAAAAIILDLVLADVREEAMRLFKTNIH